jgi:F0F1-type ATP synthase membrane subunit b/b'
MVSGEEQSYLQSSIFWTAISFGIFMVVMVRHVVPMITKALDERATKIRQDR